jgi:hypothetical protein
MPNSLGRGLSNAESPSPVAGASLATDESYRISETVGPNTARRHDSTAETIKALATMRAKIAKRRLQRTSFN